MILLRVDDVCRKPGDSPTNGTDRDLEYFRKWERESGLIGVPAIYGVVPDWLSGAGYWYLQRNFAGDQLAVHGFDHAEGAIVTQSKMSVARKLLQSPSYIPPFNIYTVETLIDWRIAGGGYFLGGFDGEHHQWGHQPKMVEGLIHLPACKFLYGHATEILPNLPTLADFPLVLTLHVPWDSPSEVYKLVSLIRDRIVSLSTVGYWCRSNGC